MARGCALTTVTFVAALQLLRGGGGASIERRFQMLHAVVVRFANVITYS